MCKNTNNKHVTKSLEKKVSTYLLCFSYVKTRKQSQAKLAYGNRSKNIWV